MGLEAPPSEALCDRRCVSPLLCGHPGIYIYILFLFWAGIIFGKFQHANQCIGGVGRWGGGGYRVTEFE